LFTKLYVEKGSTVIAIIILIIILTRMPKIVWIFWKMQVSGPLWRIQKNVSWRNQ